MFWKLAPIMRTKQGVMSHFGLAIYIKKSILRQKEELWKLKYFTMQKST
jgi:hypothetical protein